MKRTGLATLAAAAVIVLSGCSEPPDSAEAPRPAALTRDAIGYYCNMIVVDHSGPKGQIHVQDEAAPRWFASVRDALAFTRLPEEPKRIAAIYVNDMGRANWDRPEADTWVDARTAWYVIGSNRAGGMGAPETVPFARRDAAEAFAASHGGQVLTFDAIPDSAVLGPAAPQLRSDALHSGAPRSDAPRSDARQPDAPPSDAPRSDAPRSDESPSTEPPSAAGIYEGASQAGAAEHVTASSPYDSAHHGVRNR